MSNILEHLTLSINQESNYRYKLVFSRTALILRKRKRRLHLFVKIVKPAGWLIIVARWLAGESERHKTGVWHDHEIGWS